MANQLKKKVFFMQWWHVILVSSNYVVNFNFSIRLMISQKIKDESLIKAMKYACISQHLLLIIKTFTKVSFSYCTSVTFNIHNHLPYRPTFGITFWRNIIVLPYSKISFIEPLWRKTKNRLSHYNKLNQNTITLDSAGKK